MYVQNHVIPWTAVLFATQNDRAFITKTSWQRLRCCKALHTLTVPVLHMGSELVGWKHLRVTVFAGILRTSAAS
jgi:hypothetical protein